MQAVRHARPQGRRSQGILWLGVLAVAAVTINCRAWLAPFAGHGRPHSQDRIVSMRSSVVDQVDNPVRTVSETLAQFYKAYPQPPVLPMYRPFLVDLMSQTHLAMVDARFKYDVIFGLGLREFFVGVMSGYDKVLGSAQSEAMWDAMVTAHGMDPAAVKADAEAAVAYAKATSPADVLKHMEGGECSDAKVGEAFKGISSALVALPFSIGLFKLMEYSGVQVTKANVEEWADVLKVKKNKVGADFDTYKQNMNKLQKAEEMLREIEIREKKKLAQRLEEKAKALVAKAAGTTEEK